MRAAMSACSVSGTRSEAPLPEPLSTSMRIVSSTKSGLPSVRSSASAGSVAGTSPDAPASCASSFSTSCSLSSSESGSSSIAVERTRPPPQPGRIVEQLGTREADDQERRPHEVGQMLDEVEQRRLRPVDVLEEEDERLHVGDALHHLAGRPGDLLRAALAVERLHEAGGEAEHVRDCLLGAALAELLERLLERIVVGDAGSRLDHLGQAAST